MLEVLGSTVASEFVVQKICLAGDSITETDGRVGRRRLVKLEQLRGQVPLSRHQLVHVNFSPFLSIIYFAKLFTSHLH